MEEATLLYVIKDGKILLIRKKRGIGAGLYNGPGGRLENGESPEEAALRETEEEIGVRPENPEKAGVNDFFFGCERLRAHVFVSRGFRGEPHETEEAEPEWFAVDEIPYSEMWPDDEHWMPLMLEGVRFKGKFYYDEDGEKLLRHEIVSDER